MNDHPPQPVDSLLRAQQIDALCDQAEAAWQAGKRPSLEELLSTVDAATHPTLLGELLALEVHYRRQRGEAPTVEEYRERFPHAAEVIAQALTNQGPRRSQAENLEQKKLSERSSLNLKLSETLPFVPGATPTVAGSLPDKFGRYQIIKALGRGAMGVVYLARDTQLERNVALKVPQLSGPGQEDVIERFYREARAAAALRHPHICPVFDVGQIDGQHFISMAFVEGNPLTRFISPSKPPKPSAAAALIRKVALGLQEAHEHGIVHRDLKPGNIMVDARGEPTVMDFGLARDFTQKDATKVTHTGMLIGTPAYMSPEQIDSELELIGPATDIWSLGVILYELLTGQLPFPGGTIFKVISNIQNLEPKRLRELRPEVPPRLAAICHQMMAKKIENRLRSMEEVAAVLAHATKVSQSQPVDPAANAAASQSTAEPAKTDSSPPANDPVAETITLSKSATVTEPKTGESQMSAIQQIAADVTRLPHWRLLLGGAATLWLVVVVSFVIYSFSGDSPKPVAKAPENATVPPQATTPKVTIPPKATPVTPTPTPASNPATGERRLFNGKDLTGWTPLPAAKSANKNFVVWEADAQNGILKSNGLEYIDLATTEKFRDFYLRFDWRGLPGWEKKQQYTPGIIVRCDGTHGEGPRGVEIDINAGTGSKYYGTGCFMAFGTPLTNHDGKGFANASHVAYGRLKTPVLVPYPAWNRFEIRNVGDRLTVWINDELINEGWDIPSREGTIVLRDQQCANEFRNIRLSPLESSDDVAVAPAITHASLLQNLRPLTGHEGAVPTVAITADGKFGFSGGGWPNGDQSVRKWNLQTGEQVFLFRSHTGHVEGVACDPEGKFLLTTSRDQTVRLLDGLTGEELKVFRDQQKAVVKVAVSPDGRWGASSSDDFTVRMWDLRARAARGIFAGAETPTTHLTFSADNRLLAAGSYDVEIQVGEVAQGIATRNILGGPCLGLALSPDGSLLATCNPRGFVLIFATETGRLQHRLALGTPPTAVAFLPDGEHVLVAGSDRNLHRIHFRTGRGCSQPLGMGLVKLMALAAEPPILLAGGDKRDNLPQLQYGEVVAPPASQTMASYLLPPLQPEAGTREVLAWIMRLGGRLWRPGARDPLKSLQELPPGATVEAVSLEYCPLLPGEVACLLTLRPLRRLELGFTLLDDQDLQTLQPLLAEVVDLKLGHTAISDRTLQLLEGNRNMGQLDVQLTRVTDAALAKVIAQNQIRLMSFDSGQLTARLRPALQTAPRLQFLSLISLPNKPVDLKLLQGVEPNTLSLYGLNSPRGLHPAPDFSALRPTETFRALRVENYVLTQQDITGLTTLKQLKSLSFRRCEIARELVNQLSAALPGCDIKVQ